MLSSSLPAILRAQGQSEAKPPETYRDQIVAQVEHEPITFRELEIRAQLTAEYRELKKANPENAPVLRACLMRQLDSLVNERILLAEANKEKITLSKDDEKRIDRSVDHEAQIRGNLDELKKTLGQLSVPFESWVEVKRTNILVGKLLLRKVSKDIYVAPETIRKYYDQYKNEKFKRDAVTKIFVVEISFDLRTSRTPEAVQALEKTWSPAVAEQYAETVRERLVKNPSDWRKIVTECTMNASQVETGGLVQFKGTRPLAEQSILGEAADKLKVGEVSPLIPTRGAYYIVCMKERTGEGFLEFSEVQPEIYELLKQKLWSEKVNAFVKRLRDDAFVKIYLPGDEKTVAQEQKPEAPSCPETQPPVPSSQGTLEDHDGERVPHR